MSSSKILAEGISDNAGSTFLRTIDWFSQLPIEVISHIFFFLCFSDFQENRLVCTRWYEASLAPHLIHQEELVCSSNDICTELLVTVRKNRRKFYHISFRGVQASYYDNDEFWELLGPTLKSLSFQNCNVKQEQFLKILLCCPRLQSLAISDCDLLFSNNISVEDGTVTPMVLPQLHNLHTLKISNIFDPTCDLFDKLVASAPNIKSLSLDDCLSVSDENRPAALTYEHVVKTVRENARNIVHLTIVCGDEEDDEAFRSIFTLPELRLKRFQTDYSKAGSLLRLQSGLQELELTCDVDDTILTLIHWYLCDLKQLSLPYCSQVTNIGMEQVSWLRKLTSLSLLQCCRVTGEGFNNYRIPTSTLKKLTLTDLTLISHLKVVDLVSMNHGLTHLDLSYCVGVTDWSVQAIFKYQVSLRSLILIQCRSLTDAGLGGAVIPYTKLRRTDLKPPYHYWRDTRDLRDRHLNPTGFGLARLKSMEQQLSSLF